MAISPSNALVLSRAEMAIAENPDTGRIPRLDRPCDGRAVIWHHPDWRHKQALLYLQAWTSCRARGIHWTLPSWEDDPIVENLFVFLATGTCSSKKYRDVIMMVFQIYDHNELHGLGSRIKAYTVAGLIPEEIADKFSLDVDAVMGFLQIFFDVTSSLSSRDKLATLVFGFAQDIEKGASIAARREASWISTAFLGGIEMLEICTGTESDQDDGQFEETAKFVFSQMGAKAAEAAAHLRMGDAIPRKSHLEFFLEMNDVQSRVMSAQAQMASVEEERTKDDGHRRMTDFLSAVAGGVKEDDFLGASTKGGDSPVSLDSLRTPEGRKRVEDLLGIDDPKDAQPASKGRPDLNEWVKRAS